MGSHPEILNDDVKDDLRDVYKFNEKSTNAESSKLEVAMKLIQQFQETEKFLIFSQSKRMLDIIQTVLHQKNIQTCRIDGSTKKVDNQVTTFQNSNKHRVMLITTRSGGIGLTLTAATRVIIFDPDWNPSSDKQAIGRAYRLGQTKNVVVYRLITCGTLEEKIYTRQVHKDSIVHTVLNKENHHAYTYFEENKLRELFTIKDFDKSETQESMTMEHGDKISSDQKFLESDIEHLKNLPEVYGISFYSRLFSKEEHVPEEEILPFNTSTEKESEDQNRKVSEYTGQSISQFQPTSSTNQARALFPKKNDSYMGKSSEMQRNNLKRMMAQEVLEDEKRRKTNESNEFIDLTDETFPKVQSDLLNVVIDLTGCDDD